MPLALVWHSRPIARTVGCEPPQETYIRRDMGPARDIKTEIGCGGGIWTYEITLPRSSQRPRHWRTPLHLGQPSRSIGLLHTALN
jgi:hypothetical protein